MLFGRSLASSRTIFGLITANDILSSSKFSLKSQGECRQYSPLLPEQWQMNTCPSKTSFIIQYLLDFDGLLESSMIRCNFFGSSSMGRINLEIEINSVYQTDACQYTSIRALSLNYRQYFDRWIEENIWIFSLLSLVWTFQICQ